MDASASKAHVENNGVYSSYGVFRDTQNTEFIHGKPKNTSIKYTKLPEFDLDSKGLWHHRSHTLQPRIRRIVTFEEPMTISNRSWNSEQLPPRKMAVNLNRKVVTIIENDDTKPRFSYVRKVSSKKTVPKSNSGDFKEPKYHVTESSSSRLSNLYKYSREPKTNTKINNHYDKKGAKPKPYYRSKPPNISTENIRPKKVKGKDVTTTDSAKINSKSYVPQSESEKEVSIIKFKLNECLKTVKKPRDKMRLSEFTQPESKSRTPSHSTMTYRHNPQDVIHVPLESRYKRRTTPKEAKNTPCHEIELTKSDLTTTTEQIIHNDVGISTDPVIKVDSSTAVELVPCVSSATETETEPQIIYKYLHSTDVQTELIKETFDSLDIPNVTLTKSEGETKLTEEESHSLQRTLPIFCPNFHPLKVAEDDSSDANYCMSTSYIISRATLTYTTKQKFNLHVVGNNDDAYSNQTPSPLSYPINVVSVFKKEMQSEDSTHEIAVSDKRRKNGKGYKNRINDIKSLDCSYVSHGNTLMKPSDIISTIRVNNGLLQSEYICEQFERELNFIDSFFESLQYLEGALTEKCFSGDNIDALVSRRGFIENTNNLEYDSFISKLGNDVSVADTVTMASKNLFLLNLLIRDEQRRAKNLLFVLKRREDALKDFTKSQILYLENKKRQDNTDISALKKKQRGALLKLQHECGEMQRMRRALLTLSDKRKLTLMKTKKDLELKLKNNVDVDKIILGKKKLKRSASADRASPLKCFDLSSSGCDDSSTPRRNSVDTTSPEHVRVKPTSSAEKSIQTGDSILVEPLTNTADKNFIIVDGGYLNILFHNLSLPQIFSGGKQYEVNESALKSIVDTSNTQPHVHETETIQTLMERLKNRDTDASSSPSTARSLVDEFDQYYKVLQSRYDDKSASDSDNRPCDNAIVEAEYKETIASPPRSTSPELKNESDTETVVVDGAYCEKVMESVEACTCDLSGNGMEVEAKEVPVISPTGPLPVPAGEASSPETPTTDAPVWLPKSSSNTTFPSNTNCASSQTHSDSSTLSVTSFCEAEELRRQQLAIEKEIKELEQQSRMLVVREIPDKPPPPYTPPAPPRKFHVDDVTKARISVYLGMDVETEEPADAFDVFVRDFCSEAKDRTIQEKSDLPWEACNLMPPKRTPDHKKLVDVTTAELNDVLAGAKPTVVCGVSTRRSDHIDDILLSEWRRVEPEWTSLHNDEAIVKNIVFDSIFQRILTETVDEYKRTVLSSPVDD